MTYWADVPFADEYLAGEISGQVWLNSILTLKKPGTISIALNSLNVVGQGTNFPTSAEATDILYLGKTLLVISNISSTTEMTVTSVSPFEFDEMDFYIVAPASKANAQSNFAKKVLCLEQSKRYLSRIPGLALPTEGSQKHTDLKYAQVLWANMLFNGSYQDQGMKTQSNITSKKMGDASYDYDLSYSVSNIPAVVNDLISGLIQMDSFFNMD